MLDEYCITGQVPMNNGCLTSMEIAAEDIRLLIRLLNKTKFKNPLIQS